MLLIIKLKCVPKMLPCNQDLTEKMRKGKWGSLGSNQGSNGAGLLVPPVEERKCPTGM